MSHTPGPWEVQSHGHDFWVDTPCCPPQHRQDICRMSFRMTDHKVSADNARLIAASPDLLTALDMAVKYWRWMVEDNPEQAGDTERDELRWCEGILAKATGQ